MTPSRTSDDSRSASLLATVLTGWLALVILFGAAEAFVSPPGDLPVAILAGVSIPVLAFVAALAAWRGFREFVLAADLRLLTAIHAWRFLGLGFLALYANGVLPGSFAWPAGLGDIAIGVTAPWMMLALARRPGFAAEWPFALWNLLGILDLVVALGTGARAAGLEGAVTTAPMARLPLVLVPAFFVPLLVMLHIVALLRARRQRAATLAQTSGAGGSATPLATLERAPA